MANRRVVSLHDIDVDEEREEEANGLTIDANANGLTIDANADGLTIEALFEEEMPEMSSSDEGEKAKIEDPQWDNESQGRPLGKSSKDLRSYNRRVTAMVQALDSGRPIREGADQEELRQARLIIRRRSRRNTSSPPQDAERIVEYESIEVFNGHINNDNQTNMRLQTDQQYSPFNQTDQQYSPFNQTNQYGPLDDHTNSARSVDESHVDQENVTSNRGTVDDKVIKTSNIITGILRRDPSRSRPGSVPFALTDRDVVRRDVDLAMRDFEPSVPANLLGNQKYPSGIDQTKIPKNDPPTTALKTNAFRLIDRQQRLSEKIQTENAVLKVVSYGHCCIVDEQRRQHLDLMRKFDEQMAQEKRIRSQPEIDRASGTNETTLKEISTEMLNILHKFVHKTDIIQEKLSEVLERVSSLEAKVEDLGYEVLLLNSEKAFQESRSGQASPNPSYSCQFGTWPTNVNLNGPQNLYAQQR